MVPDGVHVVEFTHEGRSFFAAALETPTGLTLVDTGLPGSADELEAVLDAAGFGLDDVTSVLLTHHDGDHAGGLAGLLERRSVPVLAHERCAPFVRGERDPIKGSGERYPPAPVTVELVGGETLDTEAGPARVVHTPGHAPGHLALHFPAERFLITGDALTASDGEVSGPVPEMTPDLPEAERSVRKLAGLDVRKTLSYHGGEAETDPEEIASLV